MYHMYIYLLNKHVYIHIRYIADVYMHIKGGFCEIVIIYNY